MAGIYIHIPYCKQACHYCDFHFSTNFNSKEKLIASICNEAEKRKNFFTNKDSIQTIYFGGGTPSVLSSQELNQIIEKLASTFPLDNPEITLEANPDDINKQQLIDWKSAGINRLSIGIQSFHDKALKFMNRCHSSEEAKKAVNLSLDHGFDNLNLDLIFGIHNLSMDEFQEDLNTFINFKPKHLSTYCLTIEESTVFGNQLKKGLLEDVEENLSSQQYVIICDQLISNGYEHYEISNFGLPGHNSKHNSAYWMDKEYLGLGPSAHSFDGKNRYFNISNNAKYIKAINENTLFYDSELLTPQNKYNEYVLTRLRTSKGINLNEIETVFGTEKSMVLIKNSQILEDSNLIIKKNNILTLSQEGKLMADSICEKLFDG